MSPARSTASILILLVLAALARAQERPPNVVVVFCDDLGWGDLGCFGSETNRTPNLDALARDGLRLTDFYVAQPVCGASRAALLTGCYPNRVGISGAPDHRARHGLHPDEVTIADMLKARGYATACFGKWHLGHREPFLPTRQGFDTWYGIPYSNDMWPLHPTAGGYYPPLPLFEDEDPIAFNPDQSRLTESLVERTLGFVSRHRERPFFVYLAHPMPHVPLFCGETFRGRSRRGLYADVVEEIDAGVGRIVSKLSELGLLDDTLILFTSDNGPWLSYGDHAGSTGPFREGKGTTFEGGVRVPAILHWPAAIPVSGDPERRRPEPAGGARTAGRDLETPLMTIDLLPTLAEICGAELPKRPIDGRSFAPLLRGDPGAHRPQEAYFFWYHRNDLEALRSGRWKLHFPHAYRTLAGRPGGVGGKPVGYEQTRTPLALYDLAADPGESRDLAAERPEVVARLTELAERMRRELGDDLSGVSGSATRPAGRLPEPR